MGLRPPAFQAIGAYGFSCTLASHAVHQVATKFQQPEAQPDAIRMVEFLRGCDANGSPETARTLHLGSIYSVPSLDFTYQRPLFARRLFALRRGRAEACTGFLVSVACSGH